MSGAGCRRLRLTTALIVMAHMAHMAHMPLAAQSASEWPGRFEIGALAGSVGSSSLGSTTAAETANTLTAADPFVLFRARTEVERAAAVTGVLAYRLTKALSVEGSFRYARPSLAVSISGDAEQAGGPDVLRDRLAHYAVDVSLLIHVGRLSFGRGRGLPFAYGGAGILRQLHEGQVLSVNSRTYHAGGGVKYLIASRPNGLINGIALRGQAGVLAGRSAVAIDEAQRAQVVVSGGVLVLF